MSQLSVVLALTVVNLQASRARGYWRGGVGQLKRPIVVGRISCLLLTMPWSGVLGSASYCSEMYFDVPARR